MSTMVHLYSFAVRISVVRNNNVVGGIDSVILTALLHSCLDIHEPIELINVNFGGASIDGQKKIESPDRLAAIAAFVELRVCYLSTC